MGDELQVALVTTLGSILLGLITIGLPLLVSRRKARTVPVEPVVPDDRLDARADDVVFLVREVRDLSEKLEQVRQDRNAQRRRADRCEAREATARGER